MSSEQKIYNDLYRSIIVDEKVMFLGQILRRAAKKHPRRVALIYRGRHVSYRELYYYACKCSKAVRSKGVKKGDRVLLFFENSIEFYVGYFGILQAGAVVVPLNTFLKEHELIHIIEDAQPSLFISSVKLLGQIKYHNIKNLPPVLTENDLLTEGKVPKEFVDEKIDALPFEEMAVLLYTSGTTGMPKGVMLSSKNAITNVIQIIARFGLVGYERGFAVLPLFHSFAQSTCVWSLIMMFCTAIVVPRIDRRAMLEGLKYDPTIFLGVPALYGVLCLMGNAPLESVKYFFSGGDALPDKIRSAFSLVYRRKICSGYGLTETSPVISVEMDDVIEATGTVGKPLIGVNVAIKDQDGKDLGCEQIGEIWVSGDNVMLGYYRAPELTNDVLKNNWLRTGDLGYFDKKGKLVISGRIKDLIIHKGLNIYPQEIENIILTHPQAIFVGVIGEKDDLGGEVPVAYVQLKEQVINIEKKLRDLCMQHLAAYKVPRQFVCGTERLSLTATGKVDKKNLRIKHAKKEQK